jgi:hypothetical protein
MLTALPNPFMTIQVVPDLSPLIAQIEDLARRMISEIADIVASLREPSWERTARYHRQNLAIIEGFEDLDRSYPPPDTPPLFLEMAR